MHTALNGTETLGPRTMGEEFWDIYDSHTSCPEARERWVSRWIECASAQEQWAVLREFRSAYGVDA